MTIAGKPIDTVAFLTLSARAAELRSWIAGSTYPASQRHVAHALVLIGEAAGDLGAIDVATKTIAAMTGLKKKTIGGLVLNMAADRWLRRIGNSGKPNVFAFSTAKEEEPDFRRVELTEPLVFNEFPPDFLP